MAILLSTFLHIKGYSKRARGSFFYAESTLQRNDLQSRGKI